MQERMLCELESKGLSRIRQTLLPPRKAGGSLNGLAGPRSWRRGADARHFSRMGTAGRSLRCRRRRCAAAFDVLPRLGPPRKPMRAIPADFRQAARSEKEKRRVRESVLLLEIAKAYFLLPACVFSAYSGRMTPGSRE